MTPDNAWIYAVLPFVTMVVLAFGLYVVFRQRHLARQARSASEPPPPPRPWWANPVLWIGVCLVSIVLGVLWWPGLFGITLILIPFVWIRRPRREPPLDPRSNGHSNRDDGLFTPE